MLLKEGFMELELPSIELQSVYTEKAGPEVLGQTYNFTTKGDNPDLVCLRPEGTATCQLLARQYKTNKDLGFFYITRCWRYERPQEGRYREFTQLGVEILNPREDNTAYLIELSRHLLNRVIPEESYELNGDAKRGLAYYIDGKGWEATASILGAQKQILGGGSYPEGVGFAIGVDRVVLVDQKLKGNQQ